MYKRWRVYERNMVMQTLLKRVLEQLANKVTAEATEYVCSTRARRLGHVGTLAVHCGSLNISFYITCNGSETR